MQAGRNLDCVKALSVNDRRVPTSKGIAAVSVINVIKPNVGVGIAKLESLPVELPAEQRFNITKRRALLAKQPTLN